MKWCFSRDPALPCIAAPLKPTSPLLIILICLALIAALPAAAHAQEQPPPPPPPPPPLKVELPQGKPLIHEGQAGRELLGGTWYFRQDDTLTQGDTERWYEQDDLTGWTPITVPHNWNAADTQLNLATVGWYRKEFKLPEAPKDVLRFWKVRFEGSNYRTKVWLNGKHIGGFTGLFPFEAELKGLRKGRNTLVVKVSTLRSRTDLTHWRPAQFNGYGTGGWWNFGGLLREVYVRPVDTVDIEDVNVLPRLPRLRGPAKVEVRTTLRNFTEKERDVSLVLDVAGQHITLKPETVEPLAQRELTTRFTIEHPRLWEPGHPVLYKLTVGAVTDGKRRGAYRLNFGVRKLETRPGGIMLLNGHRLNLRGASIHEDDLEEGGALSQGTRNLLVHRLRGLGATVTRSHYPLHPAFIEAFDRLGIMYWVQAPVYQLPNSYFDQPGVRKGAERAVALTVKNNVNNPSIFTWSLANEPGGNRSELGAIGPGLQTYIREASTAVRELDDTRFVAIDRQSRVDEPPTSPAYQYLDVLGVNEYFGWYDSYRADEVRGPTTVDELGPFLDTIHAANPNLPLMITEFGAEATNHGPVEQPGTLEFQDKFARDHLRVHASKSYVNGSIYWALRDFRVDPTWLGGAPPEWANPPWHNKSPIEENNGRKPLYFELRKLWRHVKPLR
jgi:beta-galactosidase/beta-glucuronidase